MERDGIAARELKRRSREVFDGQAATYDGDMHGAHARTLYPHVAEEVVRTVAGMPAPHLLDLGCGTGALSELILDRIPGGLITCFDLSPSMLEAARARLGGSAELVLGDAEKLPFRDGSFDTAWCNDSFHHYPDPERAAFQIWRVLKKADGPCVSRSHQLDKRFRHRVGGEPHSPWIRFYHSSAARGPVRAARRAS